MDSLLDSTVTTSVSAPVSDDFLRPAKFKVAKLDSFRIVDKDDKLVTLTAAEERQYLQHKVEHSVYAPYYFYSVQQNTPARKVITVLTYDGEYKTDLLRLAYDSHNKLISRQVVAFVATDGEVRHEAYGWFESPTVFQFVEVHEEPVSETPTNANYLLDSLVTRYTVKNEQFEIVDKSTYQRQRQVPRSAE
ncbi:hypothetical protein [Hymenobacter sp. BT730]|uniref:hypothetical protein n=1 Tax=Hymenobacter sp. BT730 TaxID=3063332 RepID=UPI0026DF47BC|nr:hypothetical protein [Hymenobacter sp. BT730]